jgi:uridine phosphorylase
MTKTIESTGAWYLRCTPEQVADRAVLVGDRGRVLLAADILDQATILNEDRGLTTATGSWHGTPITVSAFGMGAPIAAVVLHELAAIGVRTVIRLGTVLALGDTQLGDFVVADCALGRDGTTASYVEAGYPAVGDLALTSSLRDHALLITENVRVGMVASFDGFYSQMFADPSVPGSTTVDFAPLVKQGVIAADMETAAILAVGRALGVRAASMCLASVDGRTHATLGPEERREAQKQLLVAGFNTLAGLPAGK